MYHTCIKHSRWAKKKNILSVVGVHDNSVWLVFEWMNRDAIQFKLFDFLRQYIVDQTYSFFF